MGNFAYDEDNPLARVKGELSDANTALHDYYAMGPGAKLTHLHQRYENERDGDTPTSSYSTIRSWSSRYKWNERVARQRDIDNEALREETRSRRRDVLDAFYEDVLTPAMSDVLTNEYKPADVIRAFDVWLDQARSEYDDLPTHKQEHSGTVGSVTLADWRERRQQIDDELSNWEAERFSDDDDDVT